MILSLASNDIVVPPRLAPLWRYLALPCLEVGVETRPRCPETGPRQASRGCSNPSDARGVNLVGQYFLIWAIIRT